MVISLSLIFGAHLHFMSTIHTYKYVPYIAKKLQTTKLTKQKNTHTNVQSFTAINIYLVSLLTSCCTCVIIGFLRRLLTNVLLTREIRIRAYIKCMTVATVDCCMLQIAH